MKVFAVIALLGLSMTFVAQEAPQVEVLPVRGNVYMLASTLGNVTMQAGKDPGHDGVMLVDTGAASLADRILVAIKQLCPNVRDSALIIPICEQRTLGRRAPSGGLLALLTM